MSQPMDGAASPSLLDPIVYSLPPRYVVSAWLEHTPFAYWLMRAARPASLVELGTHNGFSFFVWAEAAKRLGLDCRLFALDSWEGDDQAGFYGDEVFQSVAQIVEEDYPSAELVRGYFSESVGRFEDGSIDLLHIDGRHGYEDVVEDFALYESKLSAHAIVVFHDTFEFQEGFGVHRFWDEVSTSRLSFNFEHGHGLGVLAWGSEVPGPVLDFLAEANRYPEETRASFASLGTRISRQYVLEIDHFELIHDLRMRQQTNERDLQQGVERVVELENELRSAREAARTAEDETERLRRSVSWRMTAPLRAIRGSIGPIR